jgi:hypothetical protein
VNVPARWLISAVLITLPGSCIAQPPAPQPKREPEAGKVALAPVPVPLAIGQFKLNRAPQQGTIALGMAPAGTTRLVKDGAEVPIDRDGRFIIGFGREHAPVAVVVAFQSAGKSVSERIAVAPRAWKIENLPTLPPARCRVSGATPRRTRTDKRRTAN